MSEQPGHAVCVSGRVPGPGFLHPGVQGNQGGHPGGRGTPHAGPAQGAGRQPQGLLGGPFAHSLIHSKITHSFMNTPTMTVMS